MHLAQTRSSCHVGAGLTVSLVRPLCGQPDATIVSERLREADELRAYRT